MELFPEISVAFFPLATTEDTEDAEEILVFPLCPPCPRRPPWWRVDFATHSWLRMSSLSGFRPQNWNRTANSACRDGALMFGSSDVLVPNSGRPLVVSLPAPMFVVGVARFDAVEDVEQLRDELGARSAPIRKNFEKRRSTFEKPAQSTSRHRREIACARGTC